MSAGETGAAIFDELRKNKRIDYYSMLQCTKSVYNGEAEEYEEPLQLVLINVSAGGLGIVCQRHFQTDTVLHLNMKLEDQIYEKVTAKVMWTIKKGDMYRHGLEITNMSGRLYSHLSRLDNSITTTV
jgi:c-di-GMP-binding flagellar brake protein YcgR